MLHWYAALRSIASVDVHVLKKHRPSAVGGKEFLCSQAAAGTRRAAKLRRLVKTCSLFHDSEFWSWLVLLHLVAIFVQRSFCSVSTCLSRINLLRSGWIQTPGKQQWSGTCRSTNGSRRVVRKPEVLPFPLIWWNSHHCCGLGQWWGFDAFSCRSQAPGAEHSVGWKPCPALVEEPVLVWGGTVPNFKLYFCPIQAASGGSSTF